MSILLKMEERSPIPELAMRYIYYDILKPLGLQKSKKKQAKKSAHHEPVAKTVPLSDFIERLSDLGVKKGDLLVVHSSMKGLSSLDCSPNELIDALIALVGDTGTLAMPAFPNLDKLEHKDGIPVYDPERSIAWTGLLTNLLLQKEGSIRSQFPFNPLVAYGAKAEEMMRDNLNSETGHGRGSCWGYCYENHAKILFLGVLPYHSFTILHVYEDYNTGNWLPDGWYDKKQYYIQDGDKLILKTINEKGLYWAKFLAEKNTQAKYERAQLLHRETFRGIQLSYIEDAHDLLTTIDANWKKYKFIHFPRKFRKHK